MAKRKPKGRVTITNEPLTYREAGPHSFFIDLARAQGLGDDEAMTRLRRHSVESLYQRRKGATPAQRNRLAALGIEARAASSGLGFGGEFDPPAWLIPLFATAPRPGRVVADLIDQCGNAFPLDPGISSINIPRMTTGSSALIQGDGGAVSDVDLVTVDASSQVVTVAGQQDVSQQLYDLTPSPGFDRTMAIDLSAAYDKQLENELINGTGVSSPTTADSQLLGLANVARPSSNTISGAGVGTTSTSVATLWPLLGQVFGQVGNNRFLPPESFLVSPRRWAWIAGGLDSSNRPLASPGGAVYHSTAPSSLSAGGARPFGPLVGIPAYVTSGLNTGTSIETIFAWRPSDCYMWESTPKFLSTAQPLNGTLQVRVSLHKYVAAVLNRFPTSIAAVTAIPAPTGY